MSKDSHDSDKDRGFKVQDHRILGPDGKPTSTETVDNRGAETPKVDGESGTVPPIDFVSFVLSLSTSAMVHLGLTENPISHKQEEDLQVAKQEIQIIEMLKEKTKGNLNDDETRLIDDVLFHLRMKYVEKTKQ